MLAGIPWAQSAPLPLHEQSRYSRSKLDEKSGLTPQCTRLAIHWMRGYSYQCACKNRDWKIVKIWSSTEKRFAKHQAGLW